MAFSAAAVAGAVCATGVGCAIVVGAVLDYDLEIRKVLSTTNAIESMNARYRRTVNAKGHFPTEQAALKSLYLTTRSLDPKGTGQKRWMTRWKPALNVLAVVFADRMPTLLASKTTTASYTFPRTVSS